MLHERGALHLAQSGYLVQGGGDHGLAALGAVEGDGEAVRLIADALHQVQRLRGAWEHDRVVVIRQPQLLQALGDSGHVHIGNTQIAQGGGCGSHLGRTAVHEHEVRRVGKGLRLGGGGVNLPGARGRLGALGLLGQVPLETAGDDVVHAGGIVAGGVPGDAVGAVGLLGGHAVFEDHHGGDHVRTLHVRNVVTFDAQQRVGKLKGRLQLHEGGAAGGEVTGAPALVQGEGLAGVFGDGLHEFGLVAALRNGDFHGAATHLRKPGCQLFLVLGLHRHEHGARNIVAVQAFGAATLLGGQADRDIAVHAGEQLLDELRVGAVVHLFHDPAALASDSAAAHEEHLNGCLEVVLDVGEEVGIHGRAEHHGVSLESLGECRNVVAEHCGAFKVHLGGGFLHLLGQQLDVLLGASTHEAGQAAGQFAVVFGADFAHAGRRAFVDVAEQAGASAVLGTLEHAIRAGAHREDGQQGIQRFTDGPHLRVRAEVAHTLAALTAGDHCARVHVVDGHGQVRVGLIVAEGDIKARRVLLDPGVLQVQGLHLAGHHGPLDAGGGVHHRVGFGSQRLGRGEVAIEAVAQVLGLAHVDDAPVGVTEPVDARVGGNFSGGGAVAGGLCHGCFLLGRGRTYDKPRILRLPRVRAHAWMRG